MLAFHLRQHECIQKHIHFDLLDGSTFTGNRIVCFSLKCLYDRERKRETLSPARADTKKKFRSKFSHSFWQPRPFHLTLENCLQLQNFATYKKERIMSLKHFFIGSGPGALFTTLHFLHNLQMGLISQSVCNWQAFSAWCNLTLRLILSICKLRRK